MGYISRWGSFSSGRKVTVTQRAPQLKCTPKQCGCKQEYLVRLYKGGCLWTAAPLRLTNGFYIKRLAFNGWVHHGDSMQVGKRNPLGTVTFTGIDFAANLQTRVVALL
jgi:hypothetical protein